MKTFHGAILPTFHGRAFDGKETHLFGDHPLTPIVIVPRKKSCLTFEQQQRLITAIEALPELFECLTAITAYHAARLYADGKEYPEVVKQSLELIQKITDEKAPG